MPTPNQTTPDSPERTPRTDKAWNDGVRDLVTADFARQLERELNASRAETTRLAEALKEIRNRLPAQEYVQDGLTARELKHIIGFVDKALALARAALNPPSSP